MTFISCRGLRYVAFHQTDQWSNCSPSKDAAHAHILGLPALPALLPATGRHLKGGGGLEMLGGVMVVSLGQNFVFRIMKRRFLYHLFDKISLQTEQDVEETSEGDGKMLTKQSTSAPKARLSPAVCAAVCAPGPLASHSTACGHAQRIGSESSGHLVGTTVDARHPAPPETRNTPIFSGVLVVNLV